MASTGVFSKPMAWCREVATVCLVRSNLRGTLRIALIVGCILTLINQADVIFRGDATMITAAKTVLNFVVPFIVSNLGVITADRTARKRATQA
ncbi:MAG: nitrate/nitrite transporter NrtS [Chloroflexota bacterium]|nr:nitrate/nitrite transporter NrtS [Chloroflexota bacterium]